MPWARGRHKNLGKWLKQIENFWAGILWWLTDTLTQRQTMNCWDYNKLNRFHLRFDNFACWIKGNWGLSFFLTGLYRELFMSVKYVGFGFAMSLNWMSFKVSLMKEMISDHKALLLSLRKCLRWQISSTKKYFMLLH